MSFGGGWLRPDELAMMIGDFESVLSSPESPIIQIITTTAQGSYDPVFDLFDSTAGSITGMVTARAIQEVIAPRNKAVLDWGILDIGDAIFYFSPNLNIATEQNQSVVFVDPGGISWTPVFDVLKSFQTYLRARLGQQQHGQVIVARITK